MKPDIDPQNNNDTPPKDVHEPKNFIPDCALISSFNFSNNGFQGFRRIPEFGFYRISGNEDFAKSGNLMNSRKSPKSENRHVREGIRNAGNSLTPNKFWEFRNSEFN